MFRLRASLCFLRSITLLRRSFTGRKSLKDLCKSTRAARARDCQRRNPLLSSFFSGILLPFHPTQRFSKKL